MNLARSVRQLATFAGVGVLSALVDVGVFTVLHAVGVVPWLASAIGFISAFGVNYLGNRILVFRARHDARAFRRYVALVAVNLVLSTAVVAWLVGLEVEPHLAKLISMVLVAGLNYVAMRSFVFSQAPGQPAVE